MQKLVIGKSEALTKKETLYAVDFFAKAILGERLSNKVHVQVRFKDYRDGRWGEVDVLDPARKLHREFEISINPNLSKKKQLKTMIHEMIHVKQFSHGHLSSTSKHFKWMGKVVNDENVEYNNLPWEREANAAEDKLYSKYREHISSNNLTF